MDDLLSEKEQIEQIRAWWSDYGNYVIGGIVAGALILFGINYYQNSRLETQLAASGLFEQLAEHVTEGDLDEAETVAAELSAAYANTTYAAQSKLALARLYMDKNRDQDAADALVELLAVKGNVALKHVGRLRLAKIYLYQDKPDEVIALLDGVEGDSFAPRYSEVRGDAHTMLGQVAEAEAAYQAALGSANAAQSIDRALVQWKILDLPKNEASESGADEEAVEEAVEAELGPRPDNEASTDNE